MELAAARASRGALHVGYDFRRRGDGFGLGAVRDGDFAVRVGEEGFDLLGLLGEGCEGAPFCWALGAAVGGGGDGFGDWFGHFGWMVDGGDVVDDGEVLVVREWISAHVETAAFGKAGIR